MTNRRRYLNSVSSSNGGVAINNGVITSKGLSYYLTFEYPVASIIEITCGDCYWVFDIGDTDISYIPGPGEFIGTTINFYPSNRDSVYFYKVTINI